MPDKPLLILPTPEIVASQKRKPHPSTLHYPSVQCQRERLSPKFANIERAFEVRRAELLAQPTSAIPEQVLVLETVGTVDDFIKAVKAITGMEWLGEWDEEDIPPDEDFYCDEEHRDKILSGRLYLIMTNQTAIAELLSMWEKYKTNPSVVLERGRAKWKGMFHQLREIRTWGVQDRLIDTGILEDWKVRAAGGAQVVRFEAELWYKDNERMRNQATDVIKNLLDENGGKFIKQAEIPEIKYHSVLAELPINSIREILNNPNTKLIHCDQVMFFRPSGQAAVAVPTDDPLPGPDITVSQTLQGLPVVALLDGLPLENHNLLAGRLIIDDPDNWSQNYPPRERCHGTAMASLIIHDELDVGVHPLNRPLYVRPILKPDYSVWGGPAELIPEDELSVDLVHRSVKRMIEGEGGEPATAPSVRIINLSVCDPSRPLITFLSPWARLLDWLAWKYKILFVVSAGNQLDDIELDIPRDSLKNLDHTQLEIEVVRSIANSFMHRRLLSPAESINSLTIAGSHNDNSPEKPTVNFINPYMSSEMPSPINSLGLGFRRSIKPDAIFKGGKQLYSEKLGNTHEKATLQIRNTSFPPGHRYASPGKQPGELSATRYGCGTSNATALTSRIAAQIYDVLDDLRHGTSGISIDDIYIPVLLKALIIHSTSWGNTHDVLEHVLKPVSQPKKLKENINRFLGYGNITPERVYGCTGQRATLIGFNVIKNEKGHLYSLPLPPSLNGKKIWRRLIITLAWFSPINPSHRAYKRAALWFDPPKEELLVYRQESDWQAVRRGTIQHEILEGENASVFLEDQSLEIQVNCKADAGELDEAVPYAIITTLEIAEGIDISIYNEIQTRIRPIIPVIPIVPAST